MHKRQNGFVSTAVEGCTVWTSAVVALHLKHSCGTDGCLRTSAGLLELAFLQQRPSTVLLSHTLPAVQYQPKCLPCPHLVQGLLVQPQAAASHHTLTRTNPVPGGKGGSTVAIVRSGTKKLAHKTGH